MKENYRELAIKTAKEAGDILRENLGKIKRIDCKGGINLVTDIDRKSEERIISLMESNQSWSVRRIYKS